MLLFLVYATSCAARHRTELAVTINMHPLKEENVLHSC